MTDNKHTPTPWFIKDEMSGQEIHAGNSRIALVCQPGMGSSLESQANAAHIVKCVNAHDKLVAKLERLVHLHMCEQEDFMNQMIIILVI